jgi:hypothetical protein
VLTGVNYALVRDFADVRSVRQKLVERTLVQGLAAPSSDAVGGDPPIYGRYGNANVIASRNECFEEGPWTRMTLSLYLPRIDTTECRALISLRPSVDADLRMALV